MISLQPPKAFAVEVLPHNVGVGQLSQSSPVDGVLIVALQLLASMAKDPTGMKIEQIDPPRVFLPL